MLKKMNKNTKSVSGVLAIEFLLLIAIVIGVTIAMLGPSGMFQGAINSALTSTTSGMTDMSERLALSISGDEQTNATVNADDNADDSVDSDYGWGVGGGGIGDIASTGGGSGGGGSGGGGGDGTGGFGGDIVRGSGGRGSGGGDRGSGDDIGTSVDTASTPDTQVFDSEITDVLALLDGSTAGQYYFDLIAAKKISVIYQDFSQVDGISDLTLAYWQGPITNTIFVSDRLKTTMPASAIAAVIAHEATHADYDWNPEKAIAETLARHTELSRDDINIFRIDDTEIIFWIEDPETNTIQFRVLLLNSLDQEYISFVSTATVWSEIKGTDTNASLDFELFLYQQGEDVYKANLRTRGSYRNLSNF